MNKQQEALKLALEALEETLRTLDDENAKPGGAISDTIWYSIHETLFDYLTAQITALREALAEQPASGSFTLWENTLCNPLADMRTQTQSAWHDGYASAKAEREAIAEQLTQQHQDKGSGACPIPRTNELEIKPNDRRTEKSNFNIGAENQRQVHTGRSVKVYAGCAELGANSRNLEQHEGVNSSSGPSAPAQQQEPVASKQTFTRAEVIRAIEAERHACSIAVWMTLMEATEPGADDKGLDGWMREAEQRIKNRSSNDPEAAQQQELVAWIWNPAKEAWEKVHAFGHWQQETIYAFGPTMPSPLTEPQQKEPMQEIARLHERIKDLEKDVEFLSLPARQQEPVSDRENSIIRFALHQFMSNAYAHLTAAAQDKEGKRYPSEAVEKFAKDAEDAQALLKRLQFTSPPASKPWVGLTDEEKSDLWCESTGRDCVNEDTHVFADAIEAKLKDKNGY